MNMYLKTGLVLGTAVLAYSVLQPSAPIPIIPEHVLANESSANTVSPSKVAQAVTVAAAATPADQPIRQPMQPDTLSVAAQRPETSADQQLNAAVKTQQLWSSHWQEPVDFAWSQQYQTQLSDYFVTELPLRNFTAKDIQCRQSSCMLQLTLTDTDNVEQQQLKLAAALNPLRQQGKIGPYLIGQVAGQQLQAIISRPETTSE